MTFGQKKLPSSCLASLLEYTMSRCCSWVSVVACESFLYCVGNITFENLNGKKVKKKKDKRIRVVKDADQRHEVKKARYFLALQTLPAKADR